MKRCIHCLVLVEDKQWPICEVCIYDSTHHVGCRRWPGDYPANRDREDDSPWLSNAIRDYEECRSL